MGRDWTPVITVGGLAALALVLVIGVLIGRSGQGAPSKAAAAPQVVTVQGAGPAVGTAASATPGSSKAASVGSISDQWPSGKSAWTVELQALSKQGATLASVDAAKSSAKSKGATGVGVLNASSYKSLGSGYLIYSGVYTTQAKANSALGKLKKSFQSAKVVHVVPSGASGGGGGAAGGAGGGQPVSAAQQAAGAAAIQTLNNCTGAACSKAARKITKPIATPGTAPPKDNKAPGGGSGGGQTFQ
jgi:hypothetical protein